MINEPDWNRIRNAVEDVIHKYERRAYYEKKRELKKVLRAMCKALAIRKAERGARLDSDSWWSFHSHMHALLLVDAIRRTPSAIFRPDSPEVCLSRAKALERARWWGKNDGYTVTTVEVAPERVDRIVSDLSDCVAGTGFEVLRP